MSKTATTSSRFVPFKARMRTGRLRVELRAAIRYDVDQAAAALAIVSPIVPDPCTTTAMLRLLRKAAQRRLVGAKLDRADPDVTAAYRTQLLEHDVLPLGRAGQRRRSFLFLVQYDHDEAAAALAVQQPIVPTRVGQRTLQATLNEAAATGLAPKEALRKADPAVAAEYRDLLVKHGIFE
ncbi:hypothetical protein [Actinophytocola sp.]|uniref:hypothetical protein n=1 Tax=Actinophytocola sp. TaxID=1872138 RepID=UPI002ED3B356